MPPVAVEVRGISGHLCTFEADDLWSIGEVALYLAEEQGVPVEEQVLLAGVKVLSQDTLLHDLLRADKSEDGAATGNAFVLTLIRQAQPVTCRSLRDAIQRGDHSAALELLQRPTLPGLNEVHGRSGWSILHNAVAEFMEDVALAILRRPDFSCVNAVDCDGATALHCAAGIGLLDVCREILDRPDFHNLHAQLRAGGAWQFAESRWISFRSREVAADVARR